MRDYCWNCEHRVELDQLANRLKAERDEALGIADDLRSRLVGHAIGRNESARGSATFEKIATLEAEATRLNAEVSTLVNALASEREIVRASSLEIEKLTNERARLLEYLTTEKEWNADLRLCLEDSAPSSYQPTILERVETRLGDAYREAQDRPGLLVALVLMPIVWALVTLAWRS